MSLVDALLDAGFAAALSFGAAVAHVRGLPVPAAAAFLVSVGWWSYAVRNAWDAGPRKTGRPG